MQKDFENLKEKKIKINQNNQGIKIIQNRIEQNTPDILKSKTKISTKTDRDYIALNDELNNEGNYSIELIEEEEDEINSDEYISSTMLDVETDTYINYSVTNNKMEKKIINKSSTKTFKNFKNFVKAININNKDYLNQNRKSANSNSSRRNERKKNDEYLPLNSHNNKKSKFRKKIDINGNNEKENNKKNKKEIFYKKLDIKDIQNKKEKHKLDKKQKNKKNEKNIIKNYSLLEYNIPPLNNIYDEDFDLKKNNNNNYIDIPKKKISGNKKMNKRLKTDTDMGKINKIAKHIRSPTLVDNNINKNKYMKEFFIKQKYTNMDEIKYQRKNIFSPINNKIGINSLKTLNTIDNIEKPSSIINNFIKNSNFNNYLTNNIFSNNTRTISLNNNKINKYIINRNINLNNINKNINLINHIVFSPTKKIEKSSHKKTNSSYANKINSNSINVEKNQKNIFNQNINKFSERLLTYDFQDHHLLTRNRTFKNKKHPNNKNNFYNLILNKKKINLIQAKELLISSNKSPRLKIKMKIDNKNKLNLPNFKNKNKSNIYLLNNNNILKSTSNREYQDQFQTINNTINQSINKITNNKISKKNNSKNFIYLQKDNPIDNSNKTNISLKSKTNLRINPFIYQSFNNNKFIKKKILSQSKSKSKSKNKKDEKFDKNLDINMTSVNITKNSLNNNKHIKNEKIGIKKKNRQRAKTLIEEDYLRDIIINSINQENSANNTFLTNDNKSKKYNNNSKKYMSLNQLKNSSNYSSSVNDMIMKSPSERHNINFNININMNNNNYKKLIYHYHGNHGHNKSSVNYSHTNNNIPNVNKIQKKKLKL